MNQEQTLENILDYLMEPRNRRQLSDLISETKLPYQSKPIENMDDQELEALCLNMFSKNCIAR